jgi:hypothetical protein
VARKSQSDPNGKGQLENFGLVLVMRSMHGKQMHSGKIHEAKWLGKLKGWVSEVFHKLFHRRFDDSGLILKVFSS